MPLGSEEAGKHLEAPGDTTRIIQRPAQGERFGTLLTGLREIVSHDSQAGGDGKENAQAPDVTSLPMYVYRALRLLRAHFTGTADTSAPVFAIVEHASITGGTGRFEDASGGFTVRRLYDVAAGTTYGSIEGTIAF